MPHHLPPDLHHLWVPALIAVALVVAAGVLANLPLPNGAVP